MSVPDSSWCKPDANAVVGLVAWMNQDGRITVANLEGQIVREFGFAVPTESSWIWSHVLRFSPDGRHLFASYVYAKLGQGDPRQSICIWDVATGRELRRLPIRTPRRHAGPPGVGRLLLGRAHARGRPIHREIGRARGEPVVSLGDVQTAQECRKLAGHQGAALAVAFSMQDDRRLVSGGDRRDRSVLDVTADCAGNDAAAAELNADRLNALWADLAGDASRAYDAVWLRTPGPKKPRLFANASSSRPGDYPGADSKAHR